MTRKEKEPCGRIAPTTGRPCRKERQLGYEACWVHLSDDERARREKDKKEFWAKWLLAPKRSSQPPETSVRPGGLPDTPVCWKWPVTDAHRVVAAKVRKAGPEDGALDASILLDEWHDRRCAVCGCFGFPLVHDHDHDTGLVRGLLCRSCNVLEGVGRTARAVALFRSYREHPPVQILNIEVRHLNSFTGDFDYPAPPDDYDPWRDNPARQMGL